MLNVKLTNGFSTYVKRKVEGWGLIRLIISVPTIVNSRKIVTANLITYNTRNRWYLENLNVNDMYLALTLTDVSELKYHSNVIDTNNIKREVSLVHLYITLYLLQICISKINYLHYIFILIATGTYWNINIDVCLHEISWFPGLYSSIWLL